MPRVGRGLAMASLVPPCWAGLLSLGGAVKQGQQGLKACKGSPRGGEGNGKRDGWWGLEEKEKFYKRKKGWVGEGGIQLGTAFELCPGVARVGLPSARDSRGLL